MKQFENRQNVRHLSEPWP